VIAVAAPFTYRFRVRYGECDAQQIVFNARWGDYVDIAATEYTRALFGTVDPATGGVACEALEGATERSSDGGAADAHANACGPIDWRVRRQTLEWRAPARFDWLLDARVATAAVGTTSFTLRTTFHRAGAPVDDEPLVTAETVYVVVDPAAGSKLPIPERHRAALLAGDDRVVDCSGAPAAAG
jgi:acyl-CoA thioester hydrolase